MVTDHPCPTGRWLDAGGHHAQDPFVMLALLGAATTTLRLQTGILVLPYRNPFIVARAVATLDHFTKGRVILGVGTGYLKGEYRALGVDFSPAQRTHRRVPACPGGSALGRRIHLRRRAFHRTRQSHLARPCRNSRILPCWSGGNSRQAIRRAVELGDGWNPFLTSKVDLNSTRTAAFTGEADLSAAKSYLDAHSEKIGRTTAPEIVLGSIVTPGEQWTPAMLVDRIGRYQEIGVSALAVTVSGRTRSEWCDNAEHIGAEVIAKLSPATARGGS